MGEVVGSGAAGLNTIAAGRRVAVSAIPMQGGRRTTPRSSRRSREGLSPHIPFHLSRTRLPSRLHRSHGAGRCAAHDAPARGPARPPAERPHGGPRLRPEGATALRRGARGRWALDLEASWSTIHEALEGALAEGRIMSPRPSRRLRSSSAPAEALRSGAQGPLGPGSRRRTHGAAREVPAPAGGRSRERQLRMTAAFIPATYSSRGIDLPERALGVLFDAPGRCTCRCRRPSRPGHAGRQLQRSAPRHAGRGRGLAHPHEQLRAAPEPWRRCGSGSRSGDQVFEDDLARSKEPVLIRVRTAGVEGAAGRALGRRRRQCYAATSWPRLSRVGLRVDGVRCR